MTPLASAIAAAAATLKQVNGTAVTYASGTSSASVTAVVGQSTFPTEDSVSGLLTNYQTRDYLILASDLLLGGSAVEPKAGDAIAETLNGVTYTYRVTAPPGEKAWRWSDPQRVKYRVHTKLASQA